LTGGIVPDFCTIDWYWLKLIAGVAIIVIAGFIIFRKGNIIQNPNAKEK
jgi:hypothetical protein